MTREPISEIDQLKERLFRTNAEVMKLHDEIERLKAALQPFAHEYMVLMQQQDGFPAWHSIKTQQLLNAHRALEPKP